MNKKTVKAYVLLDDTSMKYLFTSGQKTILEVFCQEITSTQKENIRDFIKKEFLKKISDRTQSITLLIPRKWLTIKYLTLPSRNHNEIKNMIPFQAVKLVPYTLDEMVIDYQLLSVDSKGISTIKLFVLPKNVITRYIEPFQASGLRIEKVLPAQELAITFLKKEKIIHKKTELIIDCDRFSTDIYAMKDGDFIFSRTIPLGYGQLSDETSCSQLQSLISESVIFFKRDHSIEKLDLCVLLCGAPFLKSLEDTVKKIIHCTIEHKDFFSLPYLKSFEPKEKTSFFSLTSLLGANSYEKELSLNLLPAEFRTEQVQLEKKQQLIKTGIRGISILVLIGALFINELQFKSRFIGKIRRETQAYENKVTKLETMRKQLKTIEGYQKNQFITLKILSSLNTLMPEVIFLKDFTYRQDGLLLLKGTSPGSSEVFELVPKMETSTFFKNVSTRYVRKTRYRGKDFTDFLLESEIDAGTEQ